MADFRTDLVNEFRNQKYYLEQDLVRLVNAPVTGYKERLEEIKNCFVEIGKLNTALALADVYLPEKKATDEGAPQPAPQEPTDIVSAPEPQPAPQPLAGQTHAE